MPADLTNGWALVLIMATHIQVAAASQDPRVVVYPMMFDPSPVPTQVVTAYSAMGATTGMSMGGLIAKLCKAESAYGHNPLG